MKVFWCFLLVTLLALGTVGISYADTPPNPYGIAGFGQLNRLGMPSDCIDYDWNNLRVGTLAQMCRPNHYYDHVGIPHRWWGYNQETGEINDPQQFSNWIANNPGHVWIIGNEPDLISQDGLTREQYAHMYKTYYEFISQRDPTARFCIGATTGGSTSWQLHLTKQWYEYVLDYHKNTFGYPMHIDVWNTHSYVGPTQIEDPDQPIRDYIVPFREWYSTLDNGRYADAEFWVTEFPIGEWMGALSREWIIWFAERYLPRLEQAGVDRWFWFVSRAWTDPDGDWGGVALVGSDGTVSPLGHAYSALANSYPNEIPPVEPFVPDITPQYFMDDFSSGEISDPWMVKAGLWAVEGGSVRQSRVNYGWAGETQVLQHIYGDFHAGLKMRVNNVTNTSHWAGFTFRMQGRFHSTSNSGYLVFMRRNGAVGLHNHFDGTVAEIPNAVPDASQWQNIRVQMVGWRIQVWANDSLIIDWTDNNRRFGPGYNMLYIFRSDCSYDDVHITALPNAPIVTVDALTDSATSLSADWSEYLPPWGISESQYAIGSTPGATNVRGWTTVPGSSVTADGLSLTPGSTYYFSTRVRDTDGLWSSAEISEGITVVQVMGSPSGIKESPNGTLVGMSGVVTANANTLTRTLIVQSPDRSGAIRVWPVDMSPTPAIGSTVNIIGTLSERFGERLLENRSVTVTGTADEPIVPLAMSNRSIGGEPLNEITPSIYYGEGLYNMAMLVRTFGRVISVNTYARTFVIDDGGMIPHDIGEGLVVSYSLANGTISPPSAGQYVIVTGISSIRNGTDGKRYPILRMRSQDDLVIAP